MLQGTVLALYVAGAAAINTLDAGKGDAKHAPPPPTYNLTRALLLAEASYCTATEDQPLLPAELRKTIIVTKVVDNHATRAVVGWDASDRSLFVSFRGTENDRNWWQDAKFVKIRPYAKPYTEVAVERGFWRWYNFLKADVVKALVKAKAKFDPTTSDTPIRFYGHSAGGAVAVLAAFDQLRGSVYNGTRLVGSYTFGCPRVGSSSFAKAFSSLLGDAENWRVTHRDDLVPHLPEEALGYLHTPHEAYQKDEVKPDLTYCADSATKEDDSCSNSCYPLECTSVVDHLSYLGLVQGIGGCIEL
jgi:hypothetical protein